MSEKPIWSLRGVSSEARASAKACAADEGILIGEWLSEAIRELNSFEQSIADNSAETKSDSVVSANRMSSIERAMMRAAAGNA
ncbi:MAG: hypothetical protein CMM52_13695 [Rhodospirillaceae bacterium]|nr:hypothetical protein [Rhodospirillaceae bacterium]|tara:strand:- start:31231 stop:31479 length:249 start_codon:yes stop_codon:yes gene_type:complete